MKAEIEVVTRNDVVGEIFCLQALCPEALDDPTTLHPIAVYKAVVDPDTMYMHQAMKEPDRKQFQEAMIKEVFCP